MFSAFWCHGAPGITLSRLRAFELLKGEVHRSEAAIALAATRDAIAADFARGSGNFSLCHGLAGNADVLLEGTRTLGADWEDARWWAYRVATFGIETYATDSGWPCGILGGQAPSLMLGLAGIGLFYLRMHDTAIPSVLLLRRSGELASTRPSRS